MSSQRDRSREASEVWVVDEGRAFALPDEIAVEEPLEIRVTADGATVPVAVTMRTPGADRELAAGFLFSEGVIRAPDDVASIEEGVEQRAAGRTGFVRVGLRAGLRPSIARLERHFFASSACGVCGKSELESIVLGKIVERRDGPRVEPAVLYRLPDALRRSQSGFAKTGGLHAAAAFTADGEIVALREDVGRHNALDKLLGWALLGGGGALRDAIVMVSGRASYELVQKCSMAEAPILCAVSAPSSMAVSFARRLGLTLIGFLRGRRFNVYAGPERVADLEPRSG